MKKNSTDSRKAHAMLTVSRVLVYALLIFLSINLNHHLCVGI